MCLENILFAGVHVRNVQPGNATGSGSEGVNEPPVFFAVRTSLSNVPLHFEISPQSFFVERSYVPMDVSK